VDVAAVGPSRAYRVGEFRRNRRGLYPLGARAQLAVPRSLAQLACKRPRFTRQRRSSARVEPDTPPKALMQRLRQQFPDVYPTGAQLRTLQRRVQLWRREQIKRLIFASAGAPVSDAEALAKQNLERNDDLI
jgi:hypothetical protein